MTYTELFELALALCIKAKSHAIAHSLHLLSAQELIFVISLLTQMVS
jgi:hypothetical protein